MMTGTYNYALVALAYLVGVVSAYTALELTGRIARQRGKARYAWLAAGGCAMGFGIWTAHLVGMLSMSMRLPYTHNLAITIVCLLVGIASSVLAIWIASRRDSTIMRIAVAGTLLGAGIAAMHYTGMAAMTMQGKINFDPYIVGASVLIAVLAATAAFSIAFAFNQSSDSRPSPIWFKATAAMVMGLAISGAHYTGMAAARFQPATGANLLDEPANNAAISIWVALAALLILGFTHLTIFFDLRIAAEQRRNREAQRRALHLNELLDNSTNEIFVVDLDSMGIVNANKGACDNLGYSRDELTSMTPTDLIPSGSHALFEKRLHDLYESEDHQLYYESVHKRADGSTYPVQVHLQLSSMGDEPYLLAFATDISATKSLETQLSRSKKLEAIGRLAAGVAHEINTPAQYVGDNIRFLKGAMSEALDLVDAFVRLHSAASDGALTPELIKESGDIIKTIDAIYLAEEAPDAITQSLEGITKISSIVRAMKEFSRHGEATLELTDLNKSIQNTVVVAANEWRFTADVITDFDSQLPLVPCKPQEINQVILNLVMNAAHAIESGSAAADGTRGKIEIRTRHVGEFAEIRVSDTGNGIPESIGDRVFEPFFTTKDVAKGSGHGLSIAYTTITDGHNGTIRFESAEGVGTTFIVMLPLDAAAEQDREAVA